MLGTGGSEHLLRLQYDRLIYDALDNTFLPSVATAWSSPDEGRSWIVALRANAKAHDSQLLSAQDAAFSLWLFRDDPRMSYYAGYTATIEALDTPDASTLVVTMTQPVGAIEAYLHWIPLLPVRVWQGAGATGSGEVPTADLVGSGPFRISQYVVGEQLTLTAHRDYWMGKAKLDEVSFHVLPSADALVSALRQGDVDVVEDVPPQSLPQLAGDPSIQVVSGPQFRLHQLVLNVSSSEASRGHPALRDVRVRLAIAHSIDKQQLIDLALLSQGMPGVGVIPPSLRSWLNPKLSDVSFDLAMAQQILESAGYRDTDHDGLREMPVGDTPLEFRLWVPSDAPSSAREADMLANWLRQVGIRVIPQVRSLSALNAAGCPSCEFDLMLVDQSSPPDPGYLLSTLTSSQIDTGVNASGYSNTAYDSLFSQQAVSTDQQKRRELVWLMQDIALQDRPVIVLYYPLRVQAFRRDRFRNWLFVPTGVLSLTDERSLVQVEPVPQ